MRPSIEKQREWSAAYRRKHKDRIHLSYLKYKSKNIDKFKEKAKEYYSKNKEKIASYHRERYKKKHKEFAKYRKDNKERIRETNRIYRLNNLESKRKKDLAYYYANKEKAIKRQLKLWRSKYNKDIDFTLRILIRHRLRSAVKSMFTNKPLKKTSLKTTELIGCSLDFLKKHLESKFRDGMNWNNHGLVGWHMDHIKPISSFDLSKEEEIKKACHYTNLQPLWYYENIKKSDKMIPEVGLVAEESPL